MTTYAYQNKNSTTYANQSSSDRVSKAKAIYDTSVFDTAQYDQASDSLSLNTAYTYQTKNSTAYTNQNKS